MKRSDEILQQAFGRGLTMSERQELRESYNHEQNQGDKTNDVMRKSVKDFKDDNGLDKPRHRLLNKFPNLTECPICYRMRGYNTAHVAERNYMEDHPDDFCMKTEIHSERNFNMIMSRERIDLDGKQYTTY